ncbi:MAG: 4-alpha-glucanotransferase [Pirellulales bacterium]|nr:4-alpha-glucanotransferase [Pirellulales bacterium]
MSMDELKALAHRYGLQTDYLDIADRRKTAKSEPLLQTLRILGAPVERMCDVPEALRQRRRECWQTVLGPVVVAWDQQPARVRLRLPAKDASATARLRVELDGGEHRELEPKLGDLPEARRRKLDGEEFLAKDIELPGDLPWGYHRLHVDFAGRHAESLVIAAPRRVYEGPPGERRPFWGAFLPLYAFHRDSSWGAGDFSDLEVLMRWVAQKGGSLVATLPQLATLWELDADPSPYSPASRLFWNEFYLDVTRIPEFSGCEAARRILEQPEIREDLDAMRMERLVNYPRQMRIKRRILEALLDCFERRSGPRQGELERYRQAHPQVDEFARFRAAGERLGRFWTDWPEPLRSGRISPHDYDERIYRYHLYTQWQTEEQLRALAETAKAADLFWYLDFPLGVSGVSYDVWRERDVFALGASGGAPPDAFFTKGQDWGFPPLDPHRLRQQGYRYLRWALHRHLTYARVLRIDHAMGLQRLYWVPSGMPASEGVYVRYPRDELLALLALESHRHQARIIGENLGTVPKAFNRAMEEHGIGDMFVVQYELRPHEEEPLGTISDRAAASVNTHDMAPFMSFWTGLEIDDRLDLGLLDEKGAQEAREERSVLRQALAALLRQRGLLAPESLDPAEVLEACLALLGSSPAPIVLVNLEDLWGETLPQNTPGTLQERPNWRRKARYSFEQFCEMPGVVRILDTVNQCRKKGGKDGQLRL